MNVLFKEKVGTYYIITVLVLLTSLFFIILLASQFTEHAVPLNTPTKVIVAVVLILDLIVLVAFRPMTITVTDKMLIFGYGRFTKKFYLANIEKVEVGEYKFSNYLGYGIRYGRDKTIGYTPRGGQGLRISVKNEKKDYFFITDHAQELKSLIESRNR